MNRATWVILGVLGMAGVVAAQSTSAGCGFSFDGNSRVSTPSRPLLQNATEFTLEAWLAPSLAGTSTSDAIIEKSGSYALRINAAGAYTFDATLDPGAQTVSVSSAVGGNYSLNKRRRRLRSEQKNSKRPFLRVKRACLPCETPNKRCISSEGQG